MRTAITPTSSPRFQSGDWQVSTRPRQAEKGPVSEWFHGLLQKALPVVPYALRETGPSTDEFSFTPVSVYTFREPSYHNHAYPQGKAWVV
jgi:hypothetical protein